MKLRDMMKIHDIADKDVAKRYEDKCSIREETWLYDSSGAETWENVMELDFVEAIILLRKHLKAKQIEKGCQWWRYGVEKKFVEKEEL
tara:strand:+ start:222 stop:485 length:264 start_codon:yes stop_codon:yes gene_type:complete